MSEPAAKGTGPLRRPGIPRFGGRRLQRRRRQRVSRVHRQPDTRRPRRRRHRRQPKLSGAPSRASRSGSRRISASTTRSSRRASSSNPEYRANPVQPLLLLQARALHAPLAHRDRAARGRRRRQQRGRPGRLPPGTPGGPRVRRPQPARRSRPRRRTRSASCRGVPGCRPGTSRRPRACRRAFRITPRSPTRSCGPIERAEQAVRALGFRVFRVRHHDDLARVEIAPRRDAARARTGDRRGDRARAQSRRLSLRHARLCRATGWAV